MHGAKIKFQSLVSTRTYTTSLSNKRRVRTANPISIRHHFRTDQAITHTKIEHPFDSKSSYRCCHISKIIVSFEWMKASYKRQNNSSGTVESVDLADNRQNKTDSQLGAWHNNHNSICVSYIAVCICCDHPHMDMEYVYTYDVMLNVYNAFANPPSWRNIWNAEISNTWIYLTCACVVWNECIELLLANVRGVDSCLIRSTRSDTTRRGSKHDSSIPCGVVWSVIEKVPRGYPFELSNIRTSRLLATMHSTHTSICVYSDCDDVRVVYMRLWHP